MNGRRWSLIAAVALPLWLPHLATCAEEAKPDEGKANEASSTEELQSIRGKVVWLSSALKRRGVQVDEDVARTQCVLSGTDGRLYPLVKETRGRAFWKDKRLRNIDVELLVRPVAGSSYVQVIRVHMFEDGKKYLFDYWCDICAIQMFELQDCACCQGPIRFRKRLVPKGQTEPLPEGVEK